MKEKARIAKDGFKTTEERLKHYKLIKYRYEFEKIKKNTKLSLKKGFTITIFEKEDRMCPPDRDTMQVRVISFHDTVTAFSAV